MTFKEKHEIAERIAQLPVAEQLAFIEELVRGLRQAFTAHAALERQMEEMVNDPDVQRVLRNEDVKGTHSMGEIMQRKRFGRFIVSDPKVCHGKVTFVGTRIFVKDVLEMVATGMSWDAIIAEWHGSITREAIGEAVRLAQQALWDHADEYAV